jgi:hypothetical protein
MIKVNLSKEIYAILKKMSKKQNQKDVEAFLERFILEGSQR